MAPTKSAGSPTRARTRSSASRLTGGGASYVVTVNDLSGTGTLGLNLVDDDSIVHARRGMYPQNIEIDVRQTSLLGEKYLALVEPSAGTASSKRLRNRVSR